MDKSAYAYKFNSAKEMLDELRATDLYSPITGNYVFLYNDAGAIACYELSQSEAVELARLSRECDEYWGAFLGVGGWIFDDPSDEYHPPIPGNSNLDFCEECYKDFWIDTHDVLEFYDAEGK